MLLLWLSLVVFLAALVGGTAFAVVRVLAVLRALRTLGRATDGAMTRVADAVERVAETSARLPESSSALEPSLAQLRRSRAQLAMLTGAFSEARDAARKLTAEVPRK